MNTAHGTPQVTDEQTITIFHLVLQVYCSPSLKEHLHNPVMPLMARNIQRKESILCAHGDVCMCVLLCVHMHCVIISDSAFRMVDTSLQVYVHVLVITQVQWNIIIKFRQLLIIVVYTCLQLTQMSCYWYLLFTSKVTAPQDAHKQISAVDLPWLKHFKSSVLYVGKIFVSSL